MNSHKFYKERQFNDYLAYCVSVSTCLSYVKNVGYFFNQYDDFNYSNILDYIESRSDASIASILSSLRHYARFLKSIKEGEVNELNKIIKTPYYKRRKMISYAKGIEPPKEVQAEGHTLDYLLGELKKLGYSVTITLTS